MGLIRVVMEVRDTFQSRAIHLKVVAVQLVIEAGSVVGLLHHVVPRQGELD